MKKIFTLFAAVLFAGSMFAAEVTYTVAGNSPVAFGTTWDPTNSANDMVKQTDGTYKWEKEGLELATGNIQFKVVMNHAWTEGEGGGAWPADNYNLAISENGIYTITITFDPASSNVNATATKTGDAEIISTASIGGSFNNWGDPYQLTVSQDKKTATGTIIIFAAITYEFKVIVNGSDWRSNAQEFTRENNTATNMTGNLNNMKLVADIVGEYTFTWTFETNALEITFPSQPTNIQNTAADVKSVKRIENGQLIIIRNGEKFNAQGQIIR